MNFWGRERGGGLRAAPALSRMQILYSLFFASVLIFGGGRGVFLTGGRGLLLRVLLREYAIFPPLTGGGAAI